MRPEIKNRRYARTKAVLPVKVSGRDIQGNTYQDWAHTLDVTPDGARLGTIHRQFELGDGVTLQYRTRRADFRVVWTKLLAARGEYQIGLEMVTQERDPWGLTACAATVGAGPASGASALRH
jgi:hypothetical protein